MSQRTILIAALTVAVALAGSIGLTVMATGDGSEGENGGFLQHLHRVGNHMHGGAGHHDQMSALIDELQLTPDQLQRLERVHEIIGNAHHGDGRGTMAVLHEQLMAQIEQGRIESDEIRLVIDSHVEQIRTMAYAVTDELIELANGLDARQREILLAHLRENSNGHDSPGH